MNTTQADNEDLRGLVRRALVDMLQQGRVESADTAEALVDEPPRWRQPVPPERAIQLTLRGSERSIGLLEEALRSGVTTLEITLGAKWGPKVRVRAA